MATPLHVMIIYFMSLYDDVVTRFQVFKFKLLHPTIKTSTKSIRDFLIPFVIAHFLSHTAVNVVNANQTIKE